ncbi:unnamed protein product [Adineta steineri]|uniref:Uncharacterized protein n=1 Tax=Adineta steineri TaxID=433720 RepID=A0A814R1L6_9BILA|nr:unnamed protein product [Adineta steineri]CAF3600937.1 unnamed protein product [Adineta steineri]
MDFSELTAMTTIRPPSGPSFPDKMINPIFPPSSNPTINGLPPPIFPPNSGTSSAQFNQPAFPPTSMNQYNPSPTPPLQSSNTYNTTVNPILPPQQQYQPTPMNQYNPSPTPLSQSSNTAVNPTLPSLQQYQPTSMNQYNPSPTPPLQSSNAAVNPTLPSQQYKPPLMNQYNPSPTPPLQSSNAAVSPTPPPPQQQQQQQQQQQPQQYQPTSMNQYNPSPIPPIQSSNTYNTTTNPTPPPPQQYQSTLMNQYNPSTAPSIQSSNAAVNPTPPPQQQYQPTLMNQHNSSPTPPLQSSNTYNTAVNPILPPQQQYQPTLMNQYNPSPTPLSQSSNSAVSPTPPPQQYQPTLMNQYNPNPTLPVQPLNTYNARVNPTPPPLPSTNLYNPPPNYQPTTTAQSPSPHIRPMYPSPSSAYRAQLQQPQNIPQMTNQNSQPPPTNPSPQYGANSNIPPNTTPLSTYPGQPPMPYTTSSNTSGNTNQKLNNINGSFANNTNNIIDLLKEKSVVSPFAEEPPISPLLTEETQQMNCSPEVMRCSLNVIPQTKDLLNKSRLPLGILIHPFKDLDSLNVVQGTKIVRCDGCKSYINPFVTFVNNTQWRCSICFRTNELPQEFLFDPTTKTYGDPSRRAEVRFGTVEYAATSDYMARPPPPAMYLFLLDVSHNAIQTGYLQSFCDILFENLSSLPGDARTQIGFITYDSRIHFYDLSDRQNGTFRIMVAPDLENIENKLDEFLPVPDGLMVTLNDCRAIVETFLNELPKVYQNNSETDSALGTALLIAGKLLHQTGGRVTVMQTRIPNINPGSLNSQIAKEPTVITPTSDFYKKLSLDYASQQIACDLFLLNSHYIDLTTLSGVSKYSGGEVKYYPGFHSVHTPDEVERYENDLRRYLQRKIGFEAVMRLRTPPALSIQTFYGNGFVRSVDLLVLPNINPDAAFGMQVAIEDSLAQYKSVTLQIALLYTSSKGERRIRVHSLSLPVSAAIKDIYAYADQEAMFALIAKMAADRSTTSSIQEAREAMCNVACDIIKATMSNTSSNRTVSLYVPYAIRSLPLYMLSMIKSTAFRAASGAKMDDRAYYIDLCKTLPTQYLMQIFYPDLYPIHTIEDTSQVVRDGDDELYIPARVQLSFQHIDSHGAYILDASEYIYVFIGKAISDHFVQNVFNLQTFSALPFDSYTLPAMDNSLSIKIHNFLTYLIQSRSHGVAVHIMREDSPNRYLFTRYLVDDRSESTMSYVEFLRYIREQIGK